MAVLFLNLRRRNVKSTESFVSMIDYYSRDEAINDEALDPEGVEEMLAYYGRFDDEEVTTGFDFDGDKTTLQAKREFELYQPEQVYQAVMSFKKEDANLLDIKSKEDFYNLAQTFVVSASKQLDIKPWNLVWTGFLHENTENPHAHIYFFDKSKIEQPLLTKKELYRVRSALGNKILNQVELFKLRDEKLQETYKEVSELISTKNLDKLIKSRMVLGHKYEQLSEEDKELVRLLKKCSKSIPLKGRKQSTSLRKYYPEAFKDVEAVKEYLLKDSKGFIEFKTEVRKLQDNYQKIYGGKWYEKYEENQLLKADTKINNLIIDFVVKERDILTHPDFKIPSPPATLLSEMMTLEKNAWYQMRLGFNQMVVQASKTSGKDKEQEEKELE